MTSLRDNTSRRLRVMRRCAGATMRRCAVTTMRLCAMTTMRLGAEAVMRLRSRCRLVVVMRRNNRLWRRRRWRRLRQRDHASSTALGTYLGCPSQEPARNVPAAFATRAPRHAGVRPGTGRQRRDSRERVDRAKRQRADSQYCKCSSVYFHVFLPFGCR